MTENIVIDSPIFRYASQSDAQRKSGGGLGKSEHSYWKHDQIENLMRRQLPVLVKRGLGCIIDMHSGDGRETQHPQPDFFAGGSLKTTAAMAVQEGRRYGVPVILCEKNFERRSHLKELYGQDAQIIGSHRRLLNMQDQLDQYCWLLVISDPNGHADQGVDVMRFLAYHVACSDFIVVVNRLSIKRCLGLTNPHHPLLSIRKALQSGIENQWMLDPDKWKDFLGKRYVLPFSPMQLSNAMEAQILLIANWISGVSQ